MKLFLAFGLAWCLLVGLGMFWLIVATGGLWWWVPPIAGHYGGQLGRVVWDRVHG